MTVIIACVLALLIQQISAQIGNMFNPGMIGNMPVAETAAVPGAFSSGFPFGPANALAYPANPIPYEGIGAPGCGFGLTLADLAANGGGFSVSSSSPTVPNGVTVQSEDLMFEGPLAVTGTMPFLGSVGLEGPLPAAGQGAVAYGCGNGNVGILTEELLGAALPTNNYLMQQPMGPNPGTNGYNNMGYRPYGPMF